MIDILFKIGITILSSGVIMLLVGAIYCLWKYE